MTLFFDTWRRPVIKKLAFTLIELLIVIAIIASLAAIGIPYLLRARMNANESSIRADLKTLSTAAESFYSAQNPHIYPPNIAALAAVGVGPSYLDSSWAVVGQPRHGYNVVYLAAANTYSALATPVTPNTTGVNTFCIDQTGVIVASINGAGAPTAAAAGCTGGTASIG